MCGRFVSVSSPEALALRFGIDDVGVMDHAPRWNVAPGTQVLAILDHDGRRRLGRLHWGFVAPWTSDPAQGPRPISARIETVATSRLFRDAVRRRRCVVPIDGFYEWAPAAVGAAKRPHHLAPVDGRPLAVAAIRSVWRHDDQPPLHSMALVTTAARGVAATVHDRMPVVVPDDLLDAWLDDTIEDARPLLDELAVAVPDLRAHPVSTRVNRATEEGPDLVRPIDDHGGAGDDGHAGRGRSGAGGTSGGAGR